MNKLRIRKKIERYKPQNENIIFVIMCCIGCGFLITPILLRMTILNDLFSWMLSPLKTADYKSSYIETFGAILGTFMAVSGALWTQKKINEATEKRNIRESGLIIYYDFHFATSDIKALIERYLNSQGKIINTLEDVKQFIECKKNYRLYIDENWISNVAKLSHIFSKEDIKTIYEIYGNLNTIKQVLNIRSDKLSLEEAKLAYNIMFHEFCGTSMLLKYPIKIDVKLKDNIENIMYKLEQLI
ncbi:MAG: hypothetical protein K0R54_3632 [Clostridiaceae bacterium]|nr:hypothetical protein [Clostridiaceae bacterium]